MNKLVCTLVCVLIAMAAWAQTPNFDYPYFLSNSAGYIVTDNVYDIPEVGDWDGDGDLDLMVGVFYSGNIFYYENISTVIEPEYALHEIVQADGANIQVTYG